MIFENEHDLFLISQTKYENCLKKEIRFTSESTKQIILSINLNNHTLLQCLDTDVWA